jgi:hypothetical protein
MNRREITEVMNGAGAVAVQDSRDDIAHATAARGICGRLAQSRSDSRFLRSTDD